jgi:two-component system response regulator WspF
MRVAIVNDLSLAQAVLIRLIESVQGYSVAWTAKDGAEAVRRAAADVPDAILMDLLMPVMDGAEATRRIMAANPCPILVVTSSVGGNFGKVYEALGAGGLDATQTPTFGPGGGVEGGQPILNRLALLAQTKVKSQGISTASSAPSAIANSAAQVSTLVAIGASTGGPEAIAQVLTSMGPQLLAPVVVIQHIAADFAIGLASWLQSRTGLPVAVAQDGTEPIAGKVYIAATNDHLVLRPDRRFAYTADPKSYPYRPSVDVFFQSLAAVWPRPGVAALLTGMGSDGARGLARLKDLGWRTIVQDKASCVVYGMPRAAQEIGAAVEVLPLAQIGGVIVRRLKELPNQ